MEIEYGPFEVRIPLIEAVDAEAAAADFSRGLLRVVLPLARRAAAPVRVPVARTEE
jgi:HSP20 family molecular chaperone IbpA